MGRFGIHRKNNSPGLVVKVKLRNNSGEVIGFASELNVFPKPAQVTMSVDSQSQALLDQVNTEGNPQLYDLSVADARAGLKEMTLAMDAPESEVVKRRETSIHGPNGVIPVRIYWPRSQSEKKTSPVLLLYHGGGFALGALDTHENIARFFCNHANVIVINVDYRLSPEHKFPAGVEDCYAALCWAANNAGELKGDPGRIAVIGDSAGGNLSAVMCQLSRVRNGPEIAYQVLLYPVVSMALDTDYNSRDKFGSGYFLSQKDMQWFIELYFSDIEKEAKDVCSSPILAEDMGGLPRALIITAGNDPLRDEGKHYADRLRDAGVAVKYVCFEETIHGFMSFSGALDAGKDGLALVSRQLKENL
jgi:acetyl esterase